MITFLGYLRSARVSSSKIYDQIANGTGGSIHDGSAGNLPDITEDVIEVLYILFIE